MKKNGVNLEHFAIFYDFLKMNKIIWDIKMKWRENKIQIKQKLCEPHDQARNDDQTDQI